MNLSLIFGGLLAAGGVIALLVLESKVIGVVISGVGAVFIALSFYGDMQANKNATTADFNADKAAFDRDFAKATGDSKPAVKALSDRADKARIEADEAEGSRKEAISNGEKTRKPFMDALTRQVNGAAKKDAPADAAMSTK